MTFVIVSTLVLVSVLIIGKIAGGRLKENRMVRDMDLSVSGLITALGVTTLMAYALAIGVMATNLLDNVSAMDEAAYEHAAASEAVEEPMQVVASSESENEENPEDVEIPEMAESDSAVQESVALDGTAAPGKTEVTPAPVQSTAKSSASEQPPVTVEAAPGPAASATEFADGTYSGTGYGFRGDIAVDVTVQDGSITNVSVTDQREDRKWFERAYSGVVQRVLSAQSENVDTVSGATYSSRGIIDGVAEALSKARAAAKQVTQ